MISHKYKCIFIHIPKCAGSSIETFFGVKPFRTDKPDYKNLTGWCPKRKIHLQHATARQLQELELVTEEEFKNYFKFTFVRNPWARAYSGYKWMCHVTNTNDTFRNYINKAGGFSFMAKNNMKSRSDHLFPQTDYFLINDTKAIDFIGSVENFNYDFDFVRQNLNIYKEMNIHVQRTKKTYVHYSHFYSNRDKKRICKNYIKDIKYLNYKFDDKRKFFNKIMRCL